MGTEHGLREERERESGSGRLRDIRRYICQRAQLCPVHRGFGVIDDRGWFFYCTVERWFHSTVALCVDADGLPPMDAPCNALPSPPSPASPSPILFWVSYNSPHLNTFLFHSDVLCLSDDEMLTGARYSDVPILVPSCMQAFSVWFATAAQGAGLAENEQVLFFDLFKDYCQIEAKL